MKQYTYTEIKTIIQRDLNIENEDFMTDAELMENVNKAIDVAEACIHNLGREEDYFLQDASLAVSSGNSAIDMPSNIYGFKIRRVIFNDGNDIYRIERLRGRDKFVNIADLNANQGNEAYRYFIKNDATDGPQVFLTPAARATYTTEITMWFIRNAKRIALTTDVCEIPEAINYIFAYITEKVLAKEYGGLAPPQAVAETERQKQIMIDDLTEVVVDEDTEIIPDYDFYNDFDGQIDGLN